MKQMRGVAGLRATWIVLAAALVLGAAILPGSLQAQQLTPLRVSNFQNTVVLGLYHGIDKGYFKEAGLDVELVRVATGAAAVSAVASGQADIGWAATTVPIFARSNGVKVKVFMTADQEGPPDHYGTFIDASAKSGINSFADLKGKTVMINAFGTAGELAIRDRLQKAGLNWDDVKKVTVPFPQMQAALELGNADVAVTIQPMHAAIMANKAIGAKVLDGGTLSQAAAPRRPPQVSISRRTSGSPRTKSSARVRPRVPARTEGGPRRSGPSPRTRDEDLPAWTSNGQDNPRGVVRNARDHQGSGGADL